MKTEQEIRDKIIEIEEIINRFDNDHGIQALHLIRINQLKWVLGEE